MRKLTKIVATIGPATEKEEIIERLIKAGVNVFRFNFKHNTIAWHDERIKRVNKVADKLGVPVGTLIDLQGPEIRINMPFDQIEIKKDELIPFGDHIFNNKEKGISISHPLIIPTLKKGQRIVADDGMFVFSFEIIKGKAYLKSKSSGILKNRKSLNIPEADLSLPTLVERDFEAMKLMERNEIDFVALSFVREANDIITLRKELNKYGIKAKIVAKVETKKALVNLDEIINHADGIMVARGDLGVELSLEEVPYYQKIIIKKSINKGIPVITATQMLQTMINNPYPTRAEVSDIANAAYDLTDAVMLSAETAIGLYPLETVECMCKTLIFNEKVNMVDSRKRFNFELNDQEAILCDTAYGLWLIHRQRKEKVAGILVFTQTGRTVKLMSRYRAIVPIFAITPDKEVSESLTVNYGVKAFCPLENTLKTEVKKIDITKAIEFLLKQKLVKKGEMIITLHGDYWGVKGGTSTVKLIRI